VDFGFASLLEKFEEHYGKRSGKALVGLIGAAVVAVCLGLIWGFLAPMFGWITDTATGSSALWIATRIVGFLFVIAALMAGGGAFATYLEARKLVGLAHTMIDDAADRLEGAEKVLLAGQGLVKNLNDRIANLNEKIDKVDKFASLDEEIEAFDEPIELTRKSKVQMRDLSRSFKATKK
jgi:hypothetical protein